MYRLVFLALLLGACPTCTAVNIVIDYDYDTNNFFDPSKPEGAQARASIEAAAGFLSDLLEDSLSAVKTPPRYTGSPGLPASRSWSWTADFTHPSVPFNRVFLDDLSIAEDEFRVYVGAQEYPSDFLGFAGPGVSRWTSSAYSYSVPSQEVEILQITADFVSAVTTRGQADGEASAWGGYISFNDQINWEFEQGADVGRSEQDFYSLALHELLHTLGFGIINTIGSGQSVWETLLTSDRRAFRGDASRAAFGGNVPLDSVAGHWAPSITSTVFGGAATQQAIMGPQLLAGETFELTVLDAAGLTDLGWEVGEPTPIDRPGDFSGDGSVNNPDLNLLLNNWGQPTSPQPAGWLGWGPFGPTVNNDELNALLNNWGGGVSSVPEPTSLVLLAGFGLIGRRR